MSIIIILYSSRKPCGTHGSSILSQTSPADRVCRAGRTKTFPYAQEKSRTLESSPTNDKNIRMNVPRHGRQFIAEKISERSEISPPAPLVLPLPRRKHFKSADKRRLTRLSYCAADAGADCHAKNT